MNVLGFEISIANSNASEAVEDLSSRIQKLGQQTERLYEGPAREMKIRNEVGALVKELAIGADPLNAFISTMDRLSEMFRFALPVAVGVAALHAFWDAAVKGEEKAIEWMQAIRDGAVKAGNGTAEGLEEGIKILKKAEDEYANQGWLERILLGTGRRQTIKDILDEQLAQAEQTKDRYDAAKAQAEVQAMSTDLTTSTMGEEAEKRIALDDEIQKARNEHEDAYAAVLVEKEKAAIDEIERHRDEKLQEQADKGQQALDKEVEAWRTNNEKISAERERQKHLAVENGAPEQRLAVVQKEIDDHAIIMSMVGTELELEQRKTKEMELQNEKAHIQAEIDATHRQEQAELAKLQFDELGAAEKKAALQKESARVEAELKAGGLSDGDRTKDLIRLGQIDKAIQSLRGEDRPQYDKIGVDALRQSGGTLGGVNYNIANEAANRAEKQRDETNKLLTQLVGKPDMSRIDSF